MTFKKRLSAFTLLALLSSSLSHAVLTDRDKAELAVPRNYLTNGGCESGTAGFSAFNTTFTSGVPGTITAGSTKLSIAQATTNVLAGAASCQLNLTTAASSAGHGIIGPVMTLKDGDLARVIATRFDYNFVTNPQNVDTSGTSTQTVEVWVYNVGLGTWYQPAGYRSINTKGVTGNLLPGHTPSITFQSDSSNASNKNQYRIAWIIKNAPAGTFQMNFDSVYFGPQVTSTGPALSDMKTFPMTIGATTTAPTKGTVQTDLAYQRQVGDHLEIQYQYRQSAAGSAGSGTYLFTLPAGLSIDTSKIPVGTTQPYSMVGTATLSTSNPPVAASRVIGTVSPYDSTHLVISTMGASFDTISLVGDSFFPFSATNLIISFTAKVPILGWSSNTVTSSDTDTRVISFAGNMQAQALTGGTTDIAITPNTNGNRTGAWNGTQFIVQVPGDYFMSIRMSYAVGAGFTAAAYKNGTFINHLSTSTLSANAMATGSILIPNCIAGDILSFRSLDSITTTTADGGASIFRLSGPSVIAANESVYAKYKIGTPYTPSLNQTINYDTKVYDSHGAVTTGAGTWAFKAPISGIYSVKPIMEIGTPGGSSIYIMKNGVQSEYVMTMLNTGIISGGTEVRLLAEETIGIAIDGGAQSFGTTCSLAISRIGNL